jgi:tetratricopeptide (TPR) repeat protein
VAQQQDLAVRVAAKTLVSHGAVLGFSGTMCRPAFVCVGVALFLFSAPMVPAQGVTASPAADDTYAKIPQWGEAGETKLQSGDARGAVDEFRRAFEASRDLHQQYPQEPAYADNAYYYLGRLGSAFAAAGDLANAVAMFDPGARGYAELAATNPTPENKEKAAAALGQLAWYQVLTGNGAAAAGSAEKALELDPSLTVVRVNRAHAFLVTGRETEAEAIYLKDRDTVAEDGRVFRDIILADFTEMEKAGIQNATMARVRQELGANERSGAAGQKDDKAVWPIILLVVLFIAAVCGIIIYFDRKRSAAFEAAAKSLGFTFRRNATKEDQALITNSALTRVGRSRNFRNIIEVPEANGVRVTLFDYTYVIGHGKQSRTYSQTVTRVQSPRLQLPAFELRPEGILLKIAQSLGMRDIDFEGSPTFSKMYLLRGQDEAAIRLTFSPALLQYCEQNRGLWISGVGDMLWIHRENKRAKPADLAAFAADALQVAELFLHADGAAPAGSTPAGPPSLPQV